MIFHHTFIIHKPIADCWEVLGNQYTEVYRWASPVHHAEGDGKTGLNGASCDIRGCTLEGIGDIKEKLTAFDPEKHHLAYDVFEGLPNLLKNARNDWKLKALGTNKTELNMQAEIIPNGIVGKLLSPMLKFQFGRMTKQLGEEFKYFVETGEAHPRKVQQQKKQAALSS